MSAAAARPDMTLAVEKISAESQCTMIRAAIRLVERALAEKRDLDEVIQDTLDGRVTFGV